MKDWQGNTIQKGDTLVFVSIVKLGDPVNICVEDPVTGELIKSSVKAHDGFKFCWNPYFESTVFEYKGILHCDIPDDRNEGNLIGFPINLISDSNNDPNNIFCIKRKTDREELFFADFFKPHDN